MKIGLVKTTFLLFFLLIAWHSHAQGAPSNGEPEESGDHHSSNWVDRHIWLSERFLNAVESLDNLFGDDRIDEETNTSRMRVRMGLRYVRSDSVSLESGIRLRLVLPHLNEKLHLVFDDFFESDQPESGSSFIDAARESPADLALRFWLGEGAKQRLSVDLGGRSNPTQGLVRLRNRVTRSSEMSELQLTQSVLWLNLDGWESRMDVRWTRCLTEFWFFQSRTAILWQEMRDGITPSQSLSFIRQFRTDRALEMKFAGTWPETFKGPEIGYSIESSYRQRLNHWWLYAEVVLGVRFAQQADYESDPYAALRFDVLLGKVGWASKKPDYL
jgi:hypothetical protein